MVEVVSADLYDRDKVSDISCAYYYRTAANCKIIYYEYSENRWRKRLREISFMPKSVNPVQCVLTFKSLAKAYNEQVPYEPNKIYTNGIYTYYSGNYDGYATVLDMNSAYLYALTQPLADWTTRTEIPLDQLFKTDFDYYCFENDIYCQMFYKENREGIIAACLWADVKVYGYKAKLYYQQTARELYRLKCEVNKEKYKNIANITIGCMHKRNGKQNNTTLAASLYAWFEWYIKTLVNKFENKGYKVIMISTDSVKIRGHYNQEDNIVELGTGLGQFKIEYEGTAQYHSVGHYVENEIKWKGKPQYMRDGYSKCEFISNLRKEKKIYETYSVK